MKFSAKNVAQRGSYFRGRKISADDIRSKRTAYGNAQKDYKEADDLYKKTVGAPYAKGAKPTATFRLPDGSVMSKKEITAQRFFAKRNLSQVESEFDQNLYDYKKNKAINDVAVKGALLTGGGLLARKAYKKMTTKPSMTAKKLLEEYGAPVMGVGTISGLSYMGTKGEKRASAVGVGIDGLIGSYSARRKHGEDADLIGGALGGVAGGFGGALASIPVSTLALVAASSPKGRAAVAKYQKGQKLNADEAKALLKFKRKGNIIMPTGIAVGSGLGASYGGESLGRPKKKKMQKTAGDTMNAKQKANIVIRSGKIGVDDAMKSAKTTEEKKAILKALRQKKMQKTASLFMPVSSMSRSELLSEKRRLERMLKPGMGKATQMAGSTAMGAIAGKLIGGSAGKGAVAGMGMNAMQNLARYQRLRSINKALGKKGRK